MPVYAPTMHRFTKRKIMEPAYRPKETAGARRCNQATCGDEVQCDVSVGCADRAGEKREAPCGPRAEMIDISMCMVHVCN